MKIALVSRARTFSSPIITHLALRYNLTNKFEIYFDNNDTLFSKKNLLKTVVNKKHTFDHFKDNIYDFTKNLHTEDNFICKLWPMFLIYPPHFIHPNQSTIDFQDKIVFDISYYWDLEKYDKIYYCDRDLYSSALSFVYANKTRVWHKKKNIKNFYPKIKVDSNTICKTKFYILEYILHHKILDYLNSKNIPVNHFTDLSNCFETNFVPTNNNYKNLIENYEVIIETIDQYYPIYLQETADWKFV